MGVNQKCASCYLIKRIFGTKVCAICFVFERLNFFCQKSENKSIFKVAHTPEISIICARRQDKVTAIIDGSLAQLVEQLTFNQLVAGSNPARPTIFSFEDVKHRRAISSVGRAPPLQGGGHWFEPGIAHHSLRIFCTDLQIQ